MGATEATVDSCQAKVTEGSCGVPCRTINFFPSQAGRLPRIGKWAEIALVFYLNSLAEKIVLIAPAEFEIGKTQGPEDQDGDTCLLKSHNIPRLKRCRVKMNRKGRLEMHFDLYNAVEPYFKNRDGGQRQPQYEVIFYVKSPSECPQGFNSRGACKVPKAGWDGTSIWHWTMETSSRDEKGWSKDIEKGGFEVYNDHAKEWHQLEREQVSEEVAASFVKGDRDAAEVGGEELAEAGAYFQMARGACCCSGVEKINSQDECEAAIDELGLPRNPPWVGSAPTVPGGCSQSENGGMHWNTLPGEGAARSDISVICKKA